MRKVLRVTHKTKMPLGVRTIVVYDLVYIDGVLAGETFDYDAQGEGRAALLSTHVLPSALVCGSCGRSGSFDDDDPDDVVLLVMAMAAVVLPTPPDGGSIHPVVWLGVPRDRASVSSVPLHACQIRAPPAS